MMVLSVLGPIVISKSLLASQLFLLNSPKTSLFVCLTIISWLDPRIGAKYLIIEEMSKRKLIA